MYFKSTQHRQRFLAVIQQIGKVYDGKFDQEYAAACYILTADLEIWQKSKPYISHEGIDIPLLLNEADFSGGYGVLVQLAGNLFNGETHTEPLELFRLDDSNFHVALTALQIRRASLPLEAFEK